MRLYRVTFITHSLTVAPLASLLFAFVTHVHAPPIAALLYRSTAVGGLTALANGHRAVAHSAACL